MKVSHVLGILILSLSMFLMTGCGRSPSSTVENWLDAIINCEIDEANKYTTKNGALLNAFLVAAVKEGKKEKVELESASVIDEEINGDTAVVTVKNSDGETSQIDLVKEDGEWKVNVKK